MTEPNLLTNMKEQVEIEHERDPDNNPTWDEHRLGLIRRKGEPVLPGPEEPETTYTTVSEFKEAFMSVETDEEIAAREVRERDEAARQKVAELEAERKKNEEFRLDTNYAASPAGRNSWSGNVPERL